MKSFNNSNDGNLVLAIWYSANKLKPLEGNLGGTTKKDATNIIANFSHDSIHFIRVIKGEN